MKREREREREEKRRDIATFVFIGRLFCLFECQ